MKLITFLYCLASLPAFAQPFQPDDLGHVSDPAFPVFLKANGIQLCGAFSVRHSLDSSIYFAVIFKGNQMQFLESTGKIYPTYAEYIKATGIEESMAGGFDMENPFERTNQQDAEAFEDPEWFRGNNTHTFEKKGKVGQVFNKKKILPAIYDAIRQDLAHGQPVFIITRDGLEGIADTTGRIVVAPAYTHISGLFSNGRICYHVTDGDREGFLDIAGQVTIPLQELELRYGGNYIRTSTGRYNDRRCGLLDTMGNVVLEPLYRSAEPVTDYRGEETPVHYNAIIVETPNGGKGIFDYNGKLLLDTVYYGIDPFYEQVYRFTTAFGESGLSGLFDMASGRVMLPAEYSFEPDYSDENDTVAISRKTANGIRHGLLTKKGELLVPVEYSYVQLLQHEQVLLLGKDRDYWVTDLQLKPVQPTVYEALSPLKEHASHLPGHLLLAKKDGKDGVIDLRGNVVIPLVYDYIYPDNYILQTTQGNKSHFLDLRGNVLLTTPLKVLDCKIGYVYAKDEAGSYLLYDLYGNSLKNVRSQLFGN